MYGVSKSTVERSLQRLRPDRDYRVRGRDGKSYPASLDAQRLSASIALELRQRGQTQREIAGRLGVSQPTVSRLLRDWEFADDQQEGRA
jgi:transposase